MSDRVAADKFHFDGRGPELQRAVWDSRGTILLAVDYADADGTLRHVRFHSPQVVMFTAEEVVSDPQPGGAFDLGRSPWLQSFQQQHLGRCHHFQLLFYDELLDIICESLEFADGAFTPTI
ncbi:MAG TPA: hypothetical protein VEX43_05100 [Chthoniobacterales bacterium]|nr:hypothetical protein [Chthoniobacterales bacterium]